MHGRPRPVKGLSNDPEKVQAAKQRVALYSQLTGEVLRRRLARQYDAESLHLAAKLLEQNPEVYTVWNYRREALTPVLQGSKGQEAAQRAAVGELQLTEAALRKHIKSYATWHHRKWVVQKGLTDLQEELKLVSRLLELDDRNFHGWGYRQFIVQLAGVAAEEEDKYTVQKIEGNFSNYSAWHARTALLQKLHGTHHTITLADLLAPGKQNSAGECSRGPAGAPGPNIPSWALDEEFELVHQAFYTDPADQSGWFFHRWLVAQAVAHAHAPDAAAEATQALRVVLEREDGI
ncbi:hypothetical protein WJX72_010090 [[Myrmecia] bisecta]|uniref:Geranylgeranyl transferase type-2 subunit alpha n=1 Tax=[Myrmecia] bisecta TaxID=41462 RepID=A0AAW1Q5F0_9CHLO